MTPSPYQSLLFSWRELAEDWVLDTKEAELANAGLEQRDYHAMYQ